VIRPAITMQTPGAQSALVALCEYLETRRHDRGWYHGNVVATAKADIATLTAAGVIEDVSEKTETETP